MQLKLGVLSHSREREREGGRENGQKARKPRGSQTARCQRECQIAKLKKRTALKLPSNKGLKIIELGKLWEGQFLSPRK